MLGNEKNIYFVVSNDNRNIAIYKYRSWEFPRQKILQSGKTK